MAKKKVYCVIDTETVGTGNSLVYDFGISIVKKRELPLVEKRWLIKETMQIPNIEKLPFGWMAKNPIFAGFPITPFFIVRREFYQMLEKFEVDSITAYNLTFDKRVLENTSRWLNNGSKFFPDKISLFCLMNAVSNSIYQQKQYQNMAIRQGWLTPTGKISKKAEHIFQFVSRNFQYIHTHTALEDVASEVEILQEVFRQKKKINRW